MPEPDFSDPSFIGEGRDNPAPRQPTKGVTDSFSDLNIGVGARIRVLEDNGTRGLLGLEGVVVQSFPGEVVVQLENDPMIRHRVRMLGGIARARRAPHRHFRVTEVERI